MEKSAGAVIFYKNLVSRSARNKTKKGTIEYLLLQYPKLVKEPKKKRQIPGHWDFPKGHIEEGEEEAETVSREVLEETGIHELTFMPGFRETIRYFFQKEGKKVFKEVVFYLAQANSKNVTLSFEHLGFKWLPFPKALDITTYKNAKMILQKAHEFLTSR